MSILADWQIREQIKIKPFSEAVSGNGIISYGLTSYGYDIRLGYKYRIFTNVNSVVIDPKNISLQSMHELEADICIVPPNSYVLAESYEHVTIPRNILAVAVGKSTIARAGGIVNVTPLEPEWSGKITIEISNAAPLPLRLYSGEGIMQVLFHRCDDTVCQTSYADKQGKYQHQTGLTLPIVK